MELLEKMIELLVKTRSAYGVVTVDDPRFIQVMALDDGALRLESSASRDVLAADLGFNEVVADHEHIAAANIPAEWPAKERVAAQTLALVTVEVHGVQFPTNMDFELDLVD